MVWSEEVVVCREHPNQNPQPGVCPSCLREKLSRIADSSRKNKKISFSSPSSSYSSAYRSNYYSSASSPPKLRGHGHHRVASDIMDSIYLAISGNNGLTKSRSMAFAPRNGVGEDLKRSKNHRGFWHKLLIRSSGKKARF